VPGKPVGTVWFAMAYKQEDRLECQGHLIQFDGNRDAVRRQAVEYALNLLRSLPTMV
jgi:nicotinamide-nucleotide amidase